MELQYVKGRNKQTNKKKTFLHIILTIFKDELFFSESISDNPFKGNYEWEWK